MTFRVALILSRFAFASAWSTASQGARRSSQGRPTVSGRLLDEITSGRSFDLGCATRGRGHHRPCAGGKLRDPCTRDRKAVRLRGARADLRRDGADIYGQSISEALRPVVIGCSDLHKGNGRVLRCQSDRSDLINDSKCEIDGSAQSRYQASVADAGSRHPVSRRSGRGPLY